MTASTRAGNFGAARPGQFGGLLLLLHGDKSARALPRSALSNRGILTAPGIEAPVNSFGERTSIKTISFRWITSSTVTACSIQVLPFPGLNLSLL